MTRAFDVEVTSEDPGSGALVGADLLALATFLRITAGVPRFDLEFAGRIFRECRPSGMPSSDSILFTFERVRAIDERSSPDSAPPPKAER